MRRVSERQVGMLNIAMDVRSNLDRVSPTTIEGATKWVNEIMRGSVTLSKQRVGVKTGRTRASIRLKYTAKQGHPTAVVDYVSWLPAWIATGRHKIYADRVKALQERLGISRAKARKLVSSKRMKKVHPTYWSYRPTKQLIKNVRSEKLLERYVNASLRSLNVRV